MNLVLDAAGLTGTVEGLLSDIGGDDNGRYYAQIQMGNATVSCPHTELQFSSKKYYYDFLGPYLISLRSRGVTESEASRLPPDKNKKY